ncbi:DUF3084 domain-containing protein [Microcoleus sp. FACHB-672]|uniref:DUF3084 domain-containing protein n=1 Tax=Microcoleus sp. FACHB-672 TaxID=2692825 RepID=UPI001686EABD|nr:DUF3084 domain-containing protein [Microcoleus sp. FACHB-672]MBD2039728.1 DUF3084 domain-containing protein [Microcoleus sp. FACHB-672]
MTIGYILIVAILLLGGVLATAGDRIGTKVGKARLSLFNLRPKKTATLVTIVTGVTISASTLGILFATSEPLRKGIFEYDKIQKNIRRTRKDLEKANIEKTKVEAELSKSQAQQSAAQQRLNATNWSLQAALGKLDEAADELAAKEEQLKSSQNQLSQTIAQKEALKEEIKKRQAERQALLDQLEQGKVQIAQQNQRIDEKNQEIQQQNQNIDRKNQVIDQQNLDIARQNQEIEQTNQLLAQQNQQIEQTTQELARKNQEIEQTNLELARRNQEIEQTNLELARKNREIEQKTQLLAQQENRLQQLESQQAFLQQEVQILEREFQNLQVGTIVLRRGQVLTSAVVQIVDPSAAPQAVEKLLQQANSSALKIAQPGTDDVNEPVVQIAPAQIEELIAQISDGEEYVVRILSAANYLLGETRVQVFVDAARNRVVFMPGDVVAATSVDPKTMRLEQMRQRIELLLAASNFRARRAGILADTVQIGDGSIQTLIRFFEQLQQQNQPVDVKAIAAEETYTAGPLRVELVVIKDGKVLFQTCRPGSGIRQDCT